MSWNLRLRLRRGAKVERRLHRRAADYWESLAASGLPVRLDRFDGPGLESDASHCFLLDLADGEPRLAHVGPVLTDEAGLTQIPVPLAEVAEGSLLAQFAGRYCEVLETGAPVTAEYDFVTPAGYCVSCRGALLPLSSDGERIDHVFGAVSWKSEKVGGEEQAAG